MPKPDPSIAAHLEWLGFVRPTGLVVSAPALARHGATLNRNDAEGQRRLRDCVAERPINGDATPQPLLPDFHAFASNVLDWHFSPKGYAGTPEAPIPPELEVRLPDTGEVLRPKFAVRKDAARNTHPNSAAPKPTNGNTPEASPWQLHGRMERLLRCTGAPAGLLCNGTTLRLVSAPRGESSGWLDFRVADMVQTAGRPIAAAMRFGQSMCVLLGTFADSRKPSDRRPTHID